MNTTECISIATIVTHIDAFLSIQNNQIVAIQCAH